MRRSLIFSRLDGKKATDKLSSTSSSSLPETPSTSSTFEDIFLAELPYNGPSSIDLQINEQIEKTLMVSEDFQQFELVEPILPLPRQLYTLELNPLELDHIQEIQLASRASSFYDENRLQLIGEASDLVYALNLAATYVKKTIKFIKSISAFRQLNQDVQLTILKSFFTELLLIRFAFVFDQEKDGFAVFEVNVDSLLILVFFYIIIFIFNLILKNESCNKAVLIRLNIISEAKRQNMLLACRHYSSEFHAEMESDSILRNLVSEYTYKL